jgi:hypothetical protein
LQCKLDKQAAMQAALSLAFRDIAPRDPLLTNVYQSSELDLASRHADALERVGVLRRGRSFAWIKDQAPTTRSDLRYRISVAAEGWAWLVTGRVWPSAALEADDVLVVWNRALARPLTAMLAPSGGNYPGKPDGVLEIRYWKCLAEGLAVENADLLLARPRTHEIWKLAAQP